MKHSKRAVRAERIAKRQSVIDKRKAERRQQRLERRRARRAEAGPPSILGADGTAPAADVVVVRPLADYYLSSRTLFALERFKVFTDEDVRSLTDEQLLDINNIGPKSLKEIRDAVG